MSQHEVARFGPALIALVALVLAACDHGHAPAGASAPAIAPATAKYVSKTYALSVSYPATLGSHRDAPRTYMDAGRWKLGAGPRSQGHTLLTLTLPGSNHITSATFDIGVSRDPRALKDCLRAPAGARPADATRRIGGVDFTAFDVAEGAMSHFLNARAYRAVRDGICYAIDLRVSGTQPQVYDPPATPPFSRRQAMRRLHALLAGIRFLDPRD